MIQCVEVSLLREKARQRSEENGSAWREKGANGTRQHKGLRFLKLLMCLPIFHFDSMSFSSVVLRPITRSQGIVKGMSKG